MQPFHTNLNFQTGILQPPGKRSQVFLSKMMAIFNDSNAVRQVFLKEGDRLVYEVITPGGIPEKPGQVQYCTTILYPGVVGAEYHMTRGHFHQKRECAEVYMGLSGEGYVLMQTEDGLFETIHLLPGVIAYIPPYWAHRTTNTGDEPLIFCSSWPGDAGHDYSAIERTGFIRRLLKGAEGPELAGK
jgi:glucose-6-phosphate isomerase